MAERPRTSHKGRGRTAATTQDIVELPEEMTLPQVPTHTLESEPPPGGTENTTDKTGSTEGYIGKGLLN